MHNHPAAIWNKIAETEPLMTEWAAELFPLSQADLDKAIEAELNWAESQTDDPTVALAWIETAPLLWEHEAVSAFAARTGANLTALESVDEAILHATADRRLDGKQQESLIALLTVQPGVSEGSTDVLPKKAKVLAKVLEKEGHERGDRRLIDIAQQLRNPPEK